MWQYNYTDELSHGSKYIKKIKTPVGYRYFYSQAEIDAYNQAVKAKDDAVRAKQEAAVKDRVNKNLYRQNKADWANRRRYDNNGIMPRSEKRIRALEGRSKSNSGRYDNNGIMPRSEKRLRSMNERTKDNTQRYTKSNREKVLHMQMKKMGEKSVSEVKEAKKKSPSLFEKAFSAVKKMFKKAVKEIKFEARSTKRAVDVIIKNKPDKKGTAGMYSVDGKYFDTYKKDKKGVVRLKNRTKRKKTGRIERGILAGYRAAHPYE